MHLIRFFLLLWTLTLWSAGSSHAQKVLIVQGEGNVGFAEASAACVKALGSAGVSPNDIEVVHHKSLGTGISADTVPRLVISLGADSLGAALKWIPARTALLAGLIPRSTFERGAKDAGKRPGALLSAIYLDQPLARQADAIRQVFPDAKRVGVLLGPESQLLQPALVSVLHARGLDLATSTVGTGAPVFAALKSALDSVDVFLAVADPQVFNSTTIANILLTTYSAQVPVVAFSPAYVKAGALMAIFSTPAQIGSELGSMGGGFLQTGQLASPRFPAEFEVLVNASVARSLGVQADASAIADRLRRTEKRP